VELTIRSHPQGLVSRYLCERARAGMVVELTQARGDFVLPTPRPERLLLISGGSGITPAVSMLRTLCDEDHEGPVTFLHYARRRREVPYAAELDVLAARHGNVRIGHVYTREPESRPSGHISRAQLRALDGRYRDAEVYVCGPSGLIDGTRALWAREGREQQVHSESFLAPRVPAVPGEPGGDVSFTASGVQLPASGATLLEQAERAGLSPAYGCRMGICHTCTRRKLGGRVRNIHSGELSSLEEEDVQLCVSVPAGDVVLDL